MMISQLKTAAFLTLALAMLFLILELSLTLYQQYPQASYLDFVPEHAWFAGDFHQEDTAVFSPVKAFSHPDKISFYTELIWFEDLANRFGQAQATMAFSLHQTGKSQFELLLYIPLSKPYQTATDSIIAVLLTYDNIEITQPRYFQGHQIFTLKGPLFGRSFYFSVVKGLLIGSFSPVLMEDVLLQSYKGKSHFVKKNWFSFSRSAIQNPSRLYFQFPKLKDYLSQPHQQWAAPLLTQLFPEPHIAWYYAHSSTHELRLTSQPFGSHTAILQWLPKTTVPEKKLLKYIPAQAMAVLHIASTNLAQKLQKNADIFSPANEVLAKWLLKQAGDETLIFWTASTDHMVPDQLQVFTLRTDVTMATFWESAPTDGKWALEQPDLKMMQFIEGMDSYYVATFQGLVCVAKNKEAILSWYQRRFTTLLPSNALVEKLSANKQSPLTFAIQQEGFLPFLEGQLKDNFLLAFKQHYRQLRALDGGVYAVEWNGQNMQWQATLSFFSSGPGNGQDNRPQPLQSFFTPVSSMASGPTTEDLYVVRQGPMLTKLNHTTGAISWSLPFQGALHAAPVYLAVGHQPALHIWAGSGNQLTLLNDKGQVLKNFPFYLPYAFQVGHLGAVHTTNRETNLLYVQNKEGHVYLVRPTGLLAGGWQPRKMGGALIAPLVLHWEKDQPYYLGVTENGIVQLCNTWGRSQAGFPLLLQANLAQNIGYQEGGNLQNTLVTVLTQNGELITFNLLGDIIKRKSLDRTASTRKFYLCPNPQNMGELLIVRHDLQSLVVMDAAGESLFSISWENKGGDFTIQYLPFTPLRKLVSVFDPEKQHFQLYELNGDAVLESPLPTTLAPLVNYLPGSQTYRITYPVGKQLFVWDVES